MRSGQIQNRKVECALVTGNCELLRECVVIIII